MGNHIEDEATRIKLLSTQKYGLLPAFLNGLLDAAQPDTQIVDGNEGAYYYASSDKFYRSYQQIHQVDQAFIAPENRAKYRAQVQCAHALYFDSIFNVNDTVKISAALTPAQRAMWFSYNTYYALSSSDEYVWLYSEHLDWWKNVDLPDRLLDAITTAQTTNDKGLPIEFDIVPILQRANQQFTAPENPPKLAPTPQRANQQLLEPENPPKRK